MNDTITTRDFLPVSREDLERRGWDGVDFILVTGDAYVDHPSFGAAVVARLLEAKGYRVAVLAQPDWKSPADFKRFGRPRLGFLITAGNIDSMVNHYTASKKPRSDDAYSPGGVAGLRPDRASVVYAVRAREAYKNVPIILGGLEASLRRLSHYDYWQDKVRRSVLLDAKADLLVYGMAETSVVRIAELLSEGVPVEDIRDVRGTVYRVNSDRELPKPEHVVLLPSFEEITADKRKYAESFAAQYANTDPFSGKILAEKAGDAFAVQNPPPFPLSAEELDSVYELPFMRSWHPSYAAAGGVSAIEEVKWSLASSRGCFGACSFCALTFHQGRIVQGRSEESLLREARVLTEDDGFKGYIHDVGGPTANFRKPACRKQTTKGACTDRQCMFPEPCPALEVDHLEYLGILRKLRKLPGVKKVFVRSGIRFDYLMKDRDRTFFRELCEHHISGQLKVAPEHASNRVLRAMGKPRHETYLKFTEAYGSLNRELEKKQYLVPYLISGHPGSTIDDAILLAEYLRDSRFTPDQVQDFYPTPGTVSTCMYYSGYDPRTMEKIYVPKDGREKAMQRALLQYGKPENYRIVREALLAAGRTDLIGYGENCLIRPEGDERARYSGAIPRGKKPSPKAGRSETRAGREGRPGTRSSSAGSAGNDRSRNGREGKGRTGDGGTAKRRR